MNNSIYDRLEYHGAARGLVVGIYPTMVRVEVTPEAPYFFKDYDVVNDEAICYYNSMRNMGLRLMTKDPNAPVVNPVPEVVATTPDPEVTPDPIPTPDPAPTPDPEVTPDPIPTPDPEVTPDPIQDPEVTPDDNATAPEVGTTDEADPGVAQELAEFLDMNYDEESIKQLASDADVKIGKTKDKDAIIKKIIDSNSDYVIKLMKA